MARGRAAKLVVIPAKQPLNAPLLLVLVGPTASGKTALAVELAEQFAGEVVSCDSVSVFREVDAGTAKPNGIERARVPHHMLDIVSPDAVYTAGDYSRDARRVIQEIATRGRLPIVSGGTGLYLRALLHGLFSGPVRDEALRQRLRARAAQHGPAYVHRLLRRLDHQAALRIQPNDTPKTIRAIEVCLTTRQPMTEAWKTGRDPLTGFRVFEIGLNPDRQQLYARIDARAARMFESGLLEETQALRARYGDGIPALKALGYRQALHALTGELDLTTAVRLTQQGHRNYAKRQMSWFRREPGVHWLNGFGDKEETRAAAVELVQQAKSDQPGGSTPH